MAQVNLDLKWDKLHKRDEEVDHAKAELEALHEHFKTIPSQDDLTRQRFKNEARQLIKSFPEVISQKLFDDWRCLGVYLS